MGLGTSAGAGNSGIIMGAGAGAPICGIMGAGAGVSICGIIMGDCPFIGVITIAAGPFIGGITMGA